MLALVKCWLNDVIILQEDNASVLPQLANKKYVYIRESKWIDVCSDSIQNSETSWNFIGLKTDNLNVK